MVTEAPPRARTRWSWVRLGLIAAWALILAGAVAYGERPASMEDFDTAVAAGRVHQVSLVGGLPAGASGSAIVELHWRDGLLARVSQVRQVSSDVQPSDSSAGTDRIVVGDLAGQLSATHPGSRVVSRPDQAHESGFSGTVMGLHVPGWVALASLVAGLATLALLINGPEPWRATRWAWAWLILNPLGIIGSLAFLLLSGPVPLIPTAKTGGRRLHGGWAFLIAAVAGGAWHP
jgi:hypothetical protein